MPAVRSGVHHDLRFDVLHTLGHGFLQFHSLRYSRSVARAQYFVDLTANARVLKSRLPPTCVSDKSTKPNLEIKISCFFEI